MLICVLIFQGVASFQPIGLPHFRRIEDLFANYPLGTLIRAGAFAAGIKRRKKNIFLALKEKNFV